MTNIVWKFIFSEKLRENVGQAEKKTSCDYYLVFRKLYNLYDILWKYLIAANKKTVLIFMTECFSDLINVIILYFIVNLS